MYRALVVSNATETKNGSKRWVSLTANASSGKTSATSSQPTLQEPNIDNAHTYSIAVGYASNGLIVDIAYRQSN